MSAAAHSSPLDVGARAEVERKLDSVQATERLRILFAVESGSRAWGFPSPDSDYDCRFVYVRSRQHYLSLWPERDVVELPPAGVLDINGWDAAKAIRLLCKGNAVILEWLASPLVYREAAGLRERFASIARILVDRDRVARHYLHLGEEQMRRHMPDGPSVKQKKLFYVLRPAVALRWLRHHPGSPLPPMHLPTLMADCDLPVEVARFLGDMIDEKARVRELGEARLPDFVRVFATAEFADGRAAFGAKEISLPPARKAVADAFFAELLDEFG